MTCTPPRNVSRHQGIGQDIMSGYILLVVISAPGINTWEYLAFDSIEKQVNSIRFAMEKKFTRGLNALHLDSINAGALLSLHWRGATIGSASSEAEPFWSNLIWLKVKLFNPLPHLRHTNRVDFLKLLHKCGSRSCLSVLLSILATLRATSSSSIAWCWRERCPSCRPTSRILCRRLGLPLSSAMVGFLKILHDVLGKSVSLLQHFILHIGHGPSSAWDALVAANCQRFREDYPNADEELMEWREQRRPADWDMHYVSLWCGRPSS
ncbi:hypothetical protein IWZ01DRAFT_487113 [Phyllosticta capitalensis]